MFKKLRSSSNYTKIQGLFVPGHMLQRKGFTCFNQLGTV